MIEFTCKCGKNYAFKDELAGKRGTCKECGAPIQLPTGTTEEQGVPNGESGRPMPWDAGPARKLSRLEKKCGAAPIYLMAAARRFFSGAGTVEFRDNVLCVRGTLGPDPVEVSAFWLVVVIIGNFAIAFIPVRAVLLAGPFLFNAACVVYLLVRLLSGREMKTLFVRPEKVASVACKGPIMTIKNRTALAPGVNSIRMFISPNFRNRFFPDFDKLFPKTLPEDYRAAVKRISEADSETAED